MNRTVIIIFVVTLFELLIGIIATDRNEKIIHFEEPISDSKLVTNEQLSKDDKNRVLLRLKRKVYSWYVDTNALQSHPNKKEEDPEDEEEANEVPAIAASITSDVNATKIIKPIIVRPPSNGEDGNTISNQPGIIFSYSGTVDSGVDSSCLKNGKKVKCPTIVKLKKKAKIEAVDDGDEDSDEVSPKTPSSISTLQLRKWTTKKPSNKLKKSKSSMVILPQGVKVLYPKIHHIASPLIPSVTTSSLDKETTTEPLTGCLTNGEKVPCTTTQTPVTEAKLNTSVDESREKATETETTEAIKDSNAYVSPLNITTEISQPTVASLHNEGDDIVVTPSSMGDNPINDATTTAVPPANEIMRSAGDTSHATPEDRITQNSTEESPQVHKVEEESSKINQNVIPKVIQNVEETQKHVSPESESPKVRPVEESSSIKPVVAEPPKIRPAIESASVRPPVGELSTLRPEGQSSNMRPGGDSLNIRPISESPKPLKPELITPSGRPGPEATKLKPPGQFPIIRPPPESSNMRPPSGLSNVGPPSGSSKTGPPPVSSNVGSPPGFSNNRPLGGVSTIRPSVEPLKFKSALDSPKVRPGIETSSVRPLVEPIKIRPVTELPNIRPMVDASKSRPIIESSKNRSVGESPKARPVGEPPKGRPVTELPKSHPGGVLKGEKKIGECVSATGQKIECDQQKLPPKYDIVYAITSSEESEEMLLSGDDALPGGFKDQIKNVGKVNVLGEKHMNKSTHKFSDIKKMIKKMKFSGIKDMVINDHMKKGKHHETHFLNDNPMFNSKSNGSTKGVKNKNSNNQPFFGSSSKLINNPSKNVAKPGSDSSESVESDEVIFISSKEQFTYTREGKVVKKKINCHDENNKPVECASPLRNKGVKHSESGSLTRKTRSVLPIFFYNNMEAVKKPKPSTDFADTIQLNSKEKFSFTKEGKIKNKNIFCYNEQNEKIDCASKSKSSKKKNSKHLSRRIRGVLPPSFYKQMETIKTQPKPSDSVETVRLNSRETFSFTKEGKIMRKKLDCYNDKNEKVDCASQRKVPKKKSRKHLSRRTRGVLPPSFYQQMQRMKMNPTDSAETVKLSSREEFSFTKEGKIKSKKIYCYNEQNQRVDCSPKLKIAKSKKSRYSSRGVLPKSYFKRIKKMKIPIKPSDSQEVIRINSGEAFSYTKSANIQLTCYDGNEKVACNTLGKSASKTEKRMNINGEEKSIKDSYHPSSHKPVEQIYSTIQNEDIKQPVKPVKSKDDKRIICLDEAGNQSIDCVPSKHSSRNDKGTKTRKHKLNSAEFLTSMGKMPHSKRYRKSKISHHRKHKRNRKMNQIAQTTSEE